MKKLLLIILTVTLISLGGCDKETTFKDDYEQFKNEEVAIRKVDYEEAISAFTDQEKSYIIYLGFNPKFYECPYCLEVIPILNEVALQEEIEVLYLDIYAMRANDTKEYRLLISYIGYQTDNNDLLDDLEIRNGKKTIIVPDVYAVKNGEIVSHHIATIKDEEGNYLKDLNDENTLKLKNIYENMINLIKKEVF